MDISGSCKTHVCLVIPFRRFLFVPSLQAHVCEVYRSWEGDRNSSDVYLIPRYSGAKLKAEARLHLLAGSSGRRHTRGYALSPTNH
jgi:hypothetical protein